MPTITNVLGLPEPIVAAVTNDGYTKGDADFSITGLLKPPRIAALEATHEAELTEDVADRIYALLGQSVGKILETAGVKLPGETREHRLYRTIDVDGVSYRVSGATDRVVALPDLTIQDWKLASVWEYIYGVRPEREQQLNGYAWLYRGAGYDPQCLQDVFMFRDWSKSKAQEADEENNYPRKQVHVETMPVWEASKAEEFIRERIRLHVAARTELPLCSDADRWKDPDRFAVMKVGRKRAVKVFDFIEEALGWKAAQADAGTLRIEGRTSEPRRCALYCSVGGTTGFCSQYAAEKGAAA